MFETHFCYKTKYSNPTLRPVDTEKNTFNLFSIQIYFLTNDIKVSKKIHALLLNSTVAKGAHDESNLKMEGFHFSFQF